jgi:hypothetical protein
MVEDCPWTAVTGRRAARPAARTSGSNSAGADRTVQSVRRAGRGPGGPVVVLRSAQVQTGEHLVEQWWFHRRAAANASNEFPAVIHRRRVQTRLPDCFRSDFPYRHQGLAGG